MAGQIEERVDSPPGTGSSGSCAGSTGPFGSLIDSTGTSMRRSSCLRCPASTIVTSRADEVAADLLERVLRGAQADALQRASRLRLQALERQRQVRAALRRRD